MVVLHALKLTASAPENLWLGDESFLLGQKGYFQGLLLLVLGRVSFYNRILKGGVVIPLIFPNVP